MTDNPFSEQTELRNRGLQVEEELFYVNQQVVEKQSDFFFRLWNSEFKEKNMDVVALPGKKKEEMCVFFKHLMPYECGFTPITKFVSSPFVLFFLLFGCLIDFLLSEVQSSIFSLWPWSTE